MKVWVVSFWDGEFAANQSVWTTEAAANSEKKRLDDAYIAKYHPDYEGHPSAGIEEFTLDVAVEDLHAVADGV